MDTILKNDALNTVMNFIKNNIWIIGLLLAIIVVIILIIIFSKKRPIEIESSSSDNVGDLMNINPSLENTPNIVNNDITNNEPEPITNENIDITPSINEEVTAAPINEPLPIEPSPEPEVIKENPSIENIEDTPNLNIVDDNILNNNLMSNEEPTPIKEETQEELNAFDLPMPAQNTEVVSNQSIEPKEEVLTETLEEEPSPKVEVPQNFTTPEVTNLEDTLELPKMANAAINENITATKKCPNCGHDNPYSYKVCVKCGTILEL